MTYFDTIILALVQGITEFLPISSSGHLIIVETWLNLKVEELKIFDIAVHFGSLIAILIFFHQDFRKLFKTGFNILTFKKNDEQDAKLFWWLIFATIPVVIGGVLLADLIEESFRSSFAVGINLAIMGFLFLAIEWWHNRHSEKSNSTSSAMLIGLSQVLALFPGVSRSGITIATAIGLGLKRDEAAKFSFLLGSIAILAASTYVSLKAWLNPVDQAIVSIEQMSLGVIISGISGYLTIKYLLIFLRKYSLNIFAIYSILLGAGIIWVNL